MGVLKGEIMLKLLIILYFAIGIGITIWGLVDRYKWVSRWSLQENYKSILNITRKSLIFIFFWGFMAIYNALR